jgi:drug/metabolite transporter (DMT)-like permease
MVAALLALCSAVVWGTGDFLGGFFSRRLPFAVVSILAQVGGLCVAIAATLASGRVTGTGIGLGAAAGLFSSIGGLAYYRALSTGTMSVIAPIVACGAIVTLGLALIGGERPSAVKLAGGLTALAGAVLASFQERRKGQVKRRSVLLAVLTAACFGTLLYLLGRAANAGGAGPALLGSRLTAITGILLWIRLGRLELRRIPLRFGAVCMGIGLVSGSAALLYNLATERGLLSIVSLIASLYPVTTVVLAQAVLGERFSPLQGVGAALALGGVAVVVAG